MRPCALGDAVVDVSKQIDRCVMTTRPQPGGIERDLDVLRTINRERANNLGIATLVRTPGVVRVGDVVEPLWHFRRANCTPGRARRARERLEGAGQTASRSRAPVSADGCRSLLIARASIWRIRSRVRLKYSPTSSSVRGSPRSRPNRSARI